MIWATARDPLAKGEEPPCRVTLVDPSISPYVFQPGEAGRATLSSEFCRARRTERRAEKTSLGGWWSCERRGMR